MALVGPHDAGPVPTTFRQCQYCPTCDLPFDYCLYGGHWATCKPIALRDYKEFYEFDANFDPKFKIKDPQVKKEVKHTVRIKVTQRGRGKYLTLVYGLENFDVKLDLAAKVFKKHFASSATAKKAAKNSQDPAHIELHGDMSDELEDLLLDTWPQIKDDQIVIEG